MKRLKRRTMVMIYCAVFLVAVIICQSTSYAVTVWSNQTWSNGRTVYVIDAGHGGIDGGATSCTGILESQTNLEICIRLNDLLHLLGYDTRMIRTTDTSVYTEGKTIASQKVSDLKNRVSMVNETNQGILVSIHQNTFADGKYSGAQVFTADDDASQALAKDMQNTLVQILNPGSNRKVKTSKGIYLMENIQKPGILIECGFISNAEEAAKLNDVAYQKKLCCVIASVLVRHNTNT